MNFPAKLLLVFLCGAASSAIAQTDKAILLKDVYELPIPDSPAVVSAIYTTSAIPQIIATAKTEYGSTNQLNVIITSRLHKGRVAIFGSSAYFKTPLINNTNVSRLIGNTLSWGNLNKRKTIQIWGTTNLPPLLKKLGYHIASSNNTVIDKATGILILTDDLTTLAQYNAIKTFVSNGGTLLLASTLRPGYYENDIVDRLILSAGLYNVYDTIATQHHNNHLILSEAPGYTHLATILKALQNGTYKNWDSEQLINMRNTLSLVLSFEPINSPLIAQIQQLINPKHLSPIPSHNNPIKESDFAQYLVYDMQNILNGRQRKGATYIDPASKSFPGTVGDSAKRIDTKITIPVQVGDEGVWEPEPLYFRWHSTGLYVPPGERVTITTATKDSVQYLKAQIGVHNDDVRDHDEYTRTPYDLTKTFDLGKDTTTVYSPYGGILLIKVPDSCTLKQITLQVKGAVKEPYFKLGVTSVADWKSTIRNYDAPWTELVTDKIILDFPSYRVRNLDDPEKVLKFWDEVMDTNAKLAHLPPDRKHPERLIVDEEVAAGYLFTDDYKIVLADDEYTADMLNEVKSRRDGTWGIFHELGHRHQFAGMDFDGTTEVTVNLFTMYVYDKLLHKGIYGSSNVPDKQTVIDNIKKYMADKPSFAKWQQDPFLALSMYIEIIEGFGWQPVEDVFKYYRTIPRAQYPKQQADKRDMWFVQISKATRRNMAPFFDKWMIPVTDNAKQQVSMYPVWLPDELK